MDHIASENRLYVISVINKHAAKEVYTSFINMKKEYPSVRLVEHGYNSGKYINHYKYNFLQLKFHPKFLRQRSLYFQD